MIYQCYLNIYSIVFGCLFDIQGPVYFLQQRLLFLSKFMDLKPFLFFVVVISNTSFQDYKREKKLLSTVRPDCKATCIFQN